MSDIPTKFDSLEEAAEYILKIYRAWNSRNNSTMTGTALAGYMLADNLRSCDRACVHPRSPLDYLKVRRNV